MSAFGALQREFLEYKQKVEAEIADNARELVSLQARLVDMSLELAQSKEKFDDLLWQKDSARSSIFSSPSPRTRKVPGGLVTPSSSSEESSTPPQTPGITSWIFGKSSKRPSSDRVAKCPACGFKVKVLKREIMPEEQIDGVFILRYFTDMEKIGESGQPIWQDTVAVLNSALSESRARERSRATEIQEWKIKCEEEAMKWEREFKKWQEVVLQRVVDTKKSMRKKLHGAVTSGDTVEQTHDDSPEDDIQDEQRHSLRLSNSVKSDEGDEAEELDFVFDRVDWATGDFSHNNDHNI